jgi:hypothetical protein
LHFCLARLILGAIKLFFKQKVHQVQNGKQKAKRKQKLYQISGLGVGLLRRYRVDIGVISV